MRTWHVVFGSMMIVAATGRVAAQSPVLSTIEAPYPALHSQVQIAGGTYPAGSVPYGPAGTPLVLSGNDFGDSGTVQFVPYYKNQSNQEVQGTPVQATVSMWGSSILFLTVPSGANSGLVTVTTEGRVSNGLPFLVTPGVYSGSCPASPPSGQLQILTSSLQDGTVGQAYGSTLNAQGGTTPYTWSIASGSLPAGLSLNASTGMISGTPTTATTPVDLTVQVTSSGALQQTDDAVLTLTIDSQTLTTATIYSYAVGYEGVGNVTSYSDSIYNGGSIMGTWTYGYDTLNRLASGTATAGPFSGQSACWAYDAFGNRTDQATSNEPFASGPGSSTCQPASGASLLSNVISTYTVNGSDPGTNQVQSSNASGITASYAYDAAGNINSDGTNQYLYDAEGRVCAVQSGAPLSGGPAPLTGYIYDAEGRRVAKGTISTWSCDPTSNGFTLTESYVLDQSGQEVTQLDGNGNWQRTNTFAGSALIASYDTNGLHFHLNDPLGTRRMQTSYQGQPEEECQSWPYGDQLYCYQDSNAPATADDATPLHYTGKERDTESGNDYFGARYYGSSMGRFLSPDAFYHDSHVADPQSWNEYAYARNNPLRFTDPSGKNATVSSSCSTDANNHTTCNVTISASIAIYAAPGSGITQDQLNAAAGAMQNSIQNAWSGQFVQDGVSYNVATQVNVSVAGSQDAAMQSGAQNVIGMTNGDPAPGAGAYVNPKGLWAALTGGPDTGMMDINGVDNYAKHEFTHLLGVGDRGDYNVPDSGPAVMSNTWPNRRPDSATGQDLSWGVKEATQSVGLGLAMKSWYDGSAGPLPSPFHFSSTDTVGAPVGPWWK
jgi:RHS repeat-associated protein